MPTVDPEDWLDEQLLADDAPTRRFWRRQAVGVPRNVAIRAVPRRAQLTTVVRIEEWRLFKRHCAKFDVSMGCYVRQAIGARMVSEGVDPETIRDFLKPEGPQRARG
jgi:hypothetical protein